MSKHVDIALPDLSGRRALVTGGNSGLGFETARRLLAAGADVTITARSAEKGADALRRLQGEGSGPAGGPQGGPAGTQSGWPAGAQSGWPAGTQSGRPAGTQSGRPSGAPQGDSGASGTAPHHGVGGTGASGGAGRSGRGPDAQAPGTASLASLDLANLGSVRRLADEIVDAGHPLDLLFNNAGVMAVPRRTLTDDGFELQFGTNHLGHFALTGQLMPALQRSPHARVVTMSSIMHWMGRIDFEDLQSEERYNAWGAYGQSKLANLMFAKELARRNALLGWGVLSVAAHPGFSRTNLQSSGPNLGRAKPSRMMSAMNAVPGMTQSAAQGALPELFAATNDEVLGGDYFGPSGLFELTGEPNFAHFARRAENDKQLTLLWSRSEELTGVRFPAA